VNPSQFICTGRPVLCVQTHAQSCGHKILASMKLTSECWHWGNCRKNTKCY